MKVIPLPCTLPLIMKFLHVCFKYCCVKSFLWCAGFPSVRIAKCWLDVFPFNLRKAYLSNLSVHCVLTCYAVILLCRTVAKRRTKSHYLWQRESLPYWGLIWKWIPYGAARVPPQIERNCSLTICTHSCSHQHCDLTDNWRNVLFVLMTNIVYFHIVNWT